MDAVIVFINQNLHECTLAAQQLLVYIHLFAFAFAIVTIVNEDASILITRKLDVAELHRVATKVTYLLVILWVTGIALLSIKPGLDLQLILANPKLTAKITVVLVLTFNGLLLHVLVFPNFISSKRAQRIIVLACMLTAVSTTSWIFAGLIGAARAIAPMMNYQQYLLVYLAALTFALLISLIVIHPIMRQVIASIDESTSSSELAKMRSSLTQARANPSSTLAQCPHSARRAKARAERSSVMDSIVDR